MPDSRILITGGSGFIGTNLVSHYLRAGVSVFNVDIRAPRNSEHLSAWRECELLDLAELKRLLQSFQPTHIFHLGARTDLDGRSVEDYAANTTGVRHLIEASAGCFDLVRIVFASTRLVCRIGYQPRHARDYCPTTAYGESKIEGERLVYESGLNRDWVIVRPTSIWGPWFGVPYRNFFDAVRRGVYFHPRGERILKSFGYVGNTVHQLDRLMFADRAAVRGQMFYLCDEPPIEVGEFAEVVRAAFSAPAIRTVPISMLKLAAGVGDLLKILGIRNPPLTRFRLDNLLTQMLHDSANTQAVCGPGPHALHDAVGETVRWMTSETGRTAADTSGHSSIHER